MKVEMAGLDNVQDSGVECTSETKGSVQKNKYKYKLIPEGDSTAAENTEITSERQKEGIKLTIRISSQKKKPDCPPQIIDSESREEKGREEEKTSVGHTLRRPPRISRPTVKVAEIRDQKVDKKRGEGEGGVEEEPAALQKTDKKEHLKKTEKDINSKESKHKLLCEKLEEQLQDLDVALKKKEHAEQRKEHLVYVGISIENIIPPQEPDFSEDQEEKKKDANKFKANLLDRRSTRTRKCISYRFDEFDEAIDEAIEDDIKGADGGGVGRGKDISTITGHRVKDISTILDEEQKENKRPQRAAAACRKKHGRLNDLDSDSNLDEEESEEEFKISDGSQDEFVVSDENPDESEEDPPSNEDSDTDFGSPRLRRHPSWPMTQSRRLRRKTQKKKYSDNDEEEEESEENSRDPESDFSDDFSDDFVETRPRRSRMNQKRQINYKEDSESVGSQKSTRRGKEIRRIHKRRLSNSESEESYMSKSSDDELRKEYKRSVRKWGGSTDEYSEADEDDEEDGKPSRKWLHRIEMDEENCGNARGAGEQPVPVHQPRVLPSEQNSKKHYQIESDEEEDIENVGKVGSPLDYSLVDLPYTNVQRPGKAIENLIGKPTEKSQPPKDNSTASASLAPNGTSDGQEVRAPEEDEDELLRVNDLVYYVSNSEQL
ncbi:remodeling and spacing factor 1 [Sigmodon hispidus]